MQGGRDRAPFLAIPTRDWKGRVAEHLYQDDSLGMCLSKVKP